MNQKMAGVNTPNVKIAPNTELMKMVSPAFTAAKIIFICIQVTCCASHLHGEIKTKVKPLVASMYTLRSSHQ
jgi:hypothetical protein